MSINVLTKNREFRESNFELLRIISMILIIFSHFAGHGYFQYAANRLFIPFNNIIFALFLPLGKLGVLLFVLITGYFLINSNTKIKSLLNLFFQTLIYSISILVIFLLCGVSISKSDILASIMPITHSSYWFITAYLILYILIPVINNLLKIVETKSHESLLLGAYTILFLFIHNNITSFIYIYILGGYIRKGVFPLNRIKIKYCVCGLLCLLVFLITYTSIRVPRCINSEQISDVMHKISVIHSPVLLISAICIFYLIKNLKISTNKIINLIALSVLPVYLVHENFLIRPILWENVMNVLNQTNSYKFILLVFLIVPVIFLGCILIDKLFGYLYKPVREMMVNFVCNIACRVGKA